MIEDSEARTGEGQINATAGAVRPTKRQRELLQFIDGFIREHGYSPSYREIMQGCQYNSVATVALHVGNLIRRGHIRKRDRSARSLELTSPLDTPQKTTISSNGSAQEPDIGWLTRRVDKLYAEAERNPTQEALVGLATLVQGLVLLDLKETAEKYRRRLEVIEPPGA